MVIGDEMKNNDFVYLKELAKEKSFSTASKNLGISQPALSSFVSKLEKKLGIQLFDRTISPIELTEYGKYYLEYANAVLDATAQFENIVSDLSDVKKGTINIGSTACFSMGYLPRAIAEFRKEYDGIDFQITEGKVPEMLQKCFDGEVDMVMADENLITDMFDGEVLFEERILMCVPPNSPINELCKEYAIPTEEIINGNVNSSKFRDLDLHMVKDEKFVLLNGDQPIRKIVDEIFEKAEMKPQTVMVVPQTTTGFAMTIAGVGISFVAESTIKYNNFNEHPVYYRVGVKENVSRKMCIAYKKNKYITKAGRLFIEQLKQIFES